MNYLLALVLLFSQAAAPTAKPAEKKAEQKAAAKAEVVYVPAKEVEASMKKPGTKVFDSPKYSIMAFRRTAAGEAELHEADTDIFYIVDGSATFVTGGTIVGGKQTAPGEIRGASITGGKTRKLSKGDVITIPKNTPHWYSGVDSTLTYFIVKVR
jgi:quercetin dioxygenase-like cupin family protein